VNQPKNVFREVKLLPIVCRVAPTFHLENSWSIYDASGHVENENVDYVRKCLLIDFLWDCIVLDADAANWIA
jgi:hypothetical protein